MLDIVLEARLKAMIQKCRGYATGSYSKVKQDIRFLHNRTDFNMTAHGCCVAGFYPDDMSCAPHRQSVYVGFKAHGTGDVYSLIIV